MPSHRDEGGRHETEDEIRNHGKGLESKLDGVFAQVEVDGGRLGGKSKAQTKPRTVDGALTAVRILNVTGRSTRGPQIVMTGDFHRLPGREKKSDPDRHREND